MSGADTLARRLEGKTALITGAGSGLGRRTAHRFAGEGAEVIFLVDRDQGRLDAVATEIADAGAEAVPVCVDLGTIEGCERSLAAVTDRGTGLDVLLSNAAAWRDEPFLEVAVESWSRVLAVNLTAYFVLGQRAARMMVRQGGGVILFTASINALGHGRGFTSYCVSKAGVVALTRAMAVELAPHDIRVNAVSPGPADTQQSVDIVGAELMDTWRRDGFPPVPLNRLASPDDIAGAFAFLASDEGAYITGHNLVVDGGLTAQVYDVPDA